MIAVKVFHLDFYFPTFYFLTFHLRCSELV
jgi:hypothetical protein